MGGMLSAAQADLPTMLLMILVTSGAMAFAVLFVARCRPRAGDGLSWWGGALLLNTLAFIVFGGVRVPDRLWLLVPGNLLLSGSMAAALHSLALYRSVIVGGALIWGPMLVIGGLTWCFLDSPVWRVPSVDLVVAAQSMAVAWVVIRPSPSVPAVPLERGRFLLVAGMVLLTGLYMFRIAAVLSGNTRVVDLVTPDLSQTISYMMGLIGILFSTLGFVLMHKERSEYLYRRLAFQDALTGVPNRRAVMDSLAQVVAHGGRAREPLSVMMIDIDFFKRINDAHGHRVGDLVLTEIAQRLRRRLRAQDILGRYGGEEFLAAFPDTDIEGVRGLAEELRGDFERNPVRVPNLSIPITLSIGVHSRIPSVGRNVVEEMVLAADRALYAAKDGGRNRVCVDGVIASAKGSGEAAVA